ncbi:hypothetical protein QVD17_39134 [Tagetes erecta]|uniref:Serpin domain-containing protein n=1 Tax=Tagetes erecta TaxID=13708 RepID=A0AAD8JQ45_TARER|nr:hypothetical protein QVD17_39134 [Tagetes erecta]
MAPFCSHFIFNNLKPLFPYTRANFNTFRPRHHQSLLAKTSRDLQQSIKNQTQVSTTLATRLLSHNFPDSNVVFSPLSIHVVLSILAAGSKGPLLDQLLAFLKANTATDLNSLYSRLVPLIFADGSPNGGPRLSVANGVWVHKTFPVKPSFKEIVDNTYKATCNQVDFQNKEEVANEVNLWAEKQTNGLIKNVISANAIDNISMLILANAVYFKGVWMEKFNDSMTEEDDFHLLDGNKVQVPFMTSRNNQFVRVYDDFKVLGLPYLNGQDKRKFTMYFFLPHEKDGLPSLVEKVGSTPDFLERHIPHHKVKLREFLIPKFKILFGFEASDMLKELGLVLPFSDVGFTEMVELLQDEWLSVSSIYHKSFVDVNEEGTEAAAVTAVHMLCGSSRKKVEENIVDFVADHPFLFVIREDVSGVVLFMGQVINPQVDCKDS